MTHHPAWSSALKWDPAGGTTYTAIGQVKDIGGPSISRGTIDVTDHDSTSGYREFLAGLPDAGELSFAIGWDPASTVHDDAAGTGLIGDFLDDHCTMTTWQLTLNTCASTAIWTFAGFLTGFSPSVPVEGELTADVTVKVSGVPSLTVT